MSLYDGAVNGVCFDVIESQFEMFEDEDWLHDLLEPYFGEHTAEAESLDWYEVYLRALVLYGKVAQKELKKQFGIKDASIFPDDE